MKSKRIVVLGTLASNPWAGMAWMHMQIAAGFHRLAHDVYYFEVTSSWPYHPIHRTRVCNSDYALSYLARVAKDFGIDDRWAYRRSYSDKEWFGMSRVKAEDILEHADAVFNISGATQPSKEGLKVGPLVYFGTDPVLHEIAFAKGDRAIQPIEEHDIFVTYGENIGNPDCPVPPLPRLKSKTRQPVLLDLWRNGSPSRKEFTTVGNWKQTGRDIEYQGEIYYWSKHLEFMKFVNLPRLIEQPVELALGLDHLALHERSLLESNGWQLVNAHTFTNDPWAYRDYIQDSRGEFTVAKDQNVRLKSGWFSERSACYLAAGRPVITQDTGFGKFLPTGKGLFAYNSLDEILTAFEAINSDYEKHSRTARDIAEEYFRAETVLAKVLADLEL